jgi:hypothetical protein
MIFEGMLLATDWRGATESLRRRKPRRWRLVGALYALGGAGGIFFGFLGTISF